MNRLGSPIQFVAGGYTIHTTNLTVSPRRRKELYNLAVYDEHENDMVDNVTSYVTIYFESIDTYMELLNYRLPLSVFDSADTYVHNAVWNATEFAMGESARNSFSNIIRDIVK